MVETIAVIEGQLPRAIVGRLRDARKRLSDIRVESKQLQQQPATSTAAIAARQRQLAALGSEHDTLVGEIHTLEERLPTARLALRESLAAERTTDITNARTKARKIVARMLPLAEKLQRCNQELDTLNRTIGYDMHVPTPIVPRPQSLQAWIDLAEAFVGGKR